MCDLVSYRPWGRNFMREIKKKKNPSAILCWFQYNYNWKLRPIFAYENKPKKYRSATSMLQSKIINIKKNLMMGTKARSEPGERREVETVARRKKKETTSGTAATNQSGKKWCCRLFGINQQQKRARRKSKQKHHARVVAVFGAEETRWRKTKGAGRRSYRHILCFLFCLFVCYIRDVEKGGNLAGSKVLILKWGEGGGGREGVFWYAAIGIMPSWQVRKWRRLEQVSLWLLLLSSFQCWRRAWTSLYRDRRPPTPNGASTMGGVGTSLWPGLGGRLEACERELG